MTREEAIQTATKTAKMTGCTKYAYEHEVYGWTVGPTLPANGEQCIKVRSNGDVVFDAH